MKRILMTIMLVMIYTQAEAGTGDGDRVLAVVEKELSSLGFYTPEGVHIKSVDLESIPHEMRFSPDRTRAYVSNTGAIRYTEDVEGGTQVSVIDLQAMQVLPPISLLPYRRPHGIDVDPETGLLAVGVENPSKVLLVDPGTGEILKVFDSQGNMPHMVTVSKGAKWIYASNIASTNMVAINTQTGETQSYEIGYKPQESVLSPDEKTLYVSSDTHTAVIDLERRKQVGRIENGANRMELVRNGELLLLSSTRNGVAFVDTATLEVIYHLDLPYRPFSIHVSDDEKLAYVSAEVQGVVYTVDIDTMKIVRSFHVGDGVRPDPVMDFRATVPPAAGGMAGARPLPKFQRTEIDDDFHKAYQVKAADLNGDGRPDLVAVSDRLPEVTWYENPGWEKHVLLDQTERNIDVAPHDIDGDGDIDIALAHGFNSRESRQGGYVAWLENPGPGDAGQWRRHAIDAVPTSHRLKWADVDGDGRPELVNVPLMGIGAEAPDYDVALAHYYYDIPADPVADDWPRVLIDDQLHMAHGAQVLRWDDDVHVDLLTASFEGVTLYQAPGAGERDGDWQKSVLAAGRSGADGYTGSSEVDSGHLGGPEQRFIATIEAWHGNEVVVYRQDDSGEWQRQVIDDAFDDGHALQVADLNFDGFDEIIAGHRGGGHNLYIYQYQPEDGQWQRTGLDTGGVSAAGVVVFDANDDGHPDIAAAGAYSGNVVIYQSLAGAAR